jgi:hypothetical protein
MEPIRNMSTSQKFTAQEDVNSIDDDDGIASTLSKHASDPVVTMPPTTTLGGPDTTQPDRAQSTHSRGILCVSSTDTKACDAKVVEDATCNVTKSDCPLAVAVLRESNDSSNKGPNRDNATAPKSLLAEDSSQDEEASRMIPRQRPPPPRPLHSTSTVSTVASTNEQSSRDSNDSDSVVSDMELGTVPLPTTTTTTTTGSLPTRSLPTTAEPWWEAWPTRASTCSMALVVRFICVPVVVLVTCFYLMSIAVFVIVPTIVMLTISIACTYLCCGRPTALSLQTMLHTTTVWDSHSERSTKNVVPFMTTKEIQDAVIQRQCVTIVRQRHGSPPRLPQAECATPTLLTTPKMDPEIASDAGYVFVQDDWAYCCSKPLEQCHGLAATTGGPLVDSDDTENGSLSGGAGFECSGSSSRGPTTGPAVCSICLRRYKVGQVLAWSHNPHCRHVYHVDCITGWIEALMRAPPPSPLSPYHTTPHSCPTCRQDFLYRNTPS